MGRARIRPERRVAAYAVCLDGGAILLARYIGSEVPHWTLPGGGVDHGEDPYDAVIRELYEETGYTIEVGQLLGIESARRTFPRGRWAVADHQTFRIFYEARVVGGVLRDETGGSTDTAAWIPVDRLDELAPERNTMIDFALELVERRPPTGHLDRPTGIRNAATGSVRP